MIKLTIPEPPKGSNAAAILSAIRVRDAGLVERLLELRATLQTIVAGDGAEESDFHRELNAAIADLTWVACRDLKDNKVAPICTLSQAMGDDNDCTEFVLDQLAKRSGTIKVGGGAAPLIEITHVRD